MQLILASASPRRLELLSQIGVVPDLVHPADIDEQPHDREIPATYARRMADEKYLAVGRLYPTDITLAADTVVACGRRILGKAKDEGEAAGMLRLLSGRRHQVVGAIAVGRGTASPSLRLVKTIVGFKRLHATEIAAYLKSGEWRDKAGAYAIQGKAATFVDWIGGSYSNVVGISLYDLSMMLTGIGYRL